MLPTKATIAQTEEYNRPPPTPKPDGVVNDPRVHSQSSSVRLVPEFALGLASLG
jgi:hypothetical protein